MARETAVMCPGSSRLTGVVRHGRPPHRFECVECGREVGSVWSQENPRWTTKEHYPRRVQNDD